VVPSAAILIVKDHDDFRVFARATLEADGFTVAKARWPAATAR
jgi:hypothetical protein